MSFIYNKETTLTKERAQALAVLMPTIHAEATVAASEACTEVLNKYGNRDACGFAWVEVYGVRTNSKLGKALIAVGFSKSYTGALQLWNPSTNPTQAITAKEKGADAYAEVLRTYGIERAYAGSRID